MCVCVCVCVCVYVYICTHTYIYKEPTHALNGPPAGHGGGRPGPALNRSSEWLVLSRTILPIGSE